MMLLSLLPLFFFGLTESSTKVCVAQRDPFYVSRAAPARKVNRPAKMPTVLGLIEVKKGALVRFGNKNEIVHVGDRVNGYTIIAITNNHVVARTSQGERKKWLI